MDDTGRKATIEQLVVGPLSTNCYVVSCPETKRAIVVDPGGDPGLIEALVESRGLAVEQVLCTHGHGDHFAAAAGLCRRWDAPFAVHAAAREMIAISVSEAPYWGLGEIEAPEIGREIVPGEPLVVGEVAGRVLFTPGHSPGSVSFVFGGRVLVGDALFRRSIGRTDLQGGDLETLLYSIRTELFTLPDETIVYCGHGPDTTIGEEKRGNPFLNGSF
ncbi:MAG: MBL fold metallo-hydrolase [Candidatus Krumholzibacteriota bacterium]|nr:MBL fold metallo-hydrolase [Candidatus Krumholzibacteriota bacterium]